MSIKDVHPQRFTEEVSKELKQLEEIDPPEWSNFVKTGPHKERPPDEEDWWYLRSASILRNVYRRGPIGVSRLRSIYGGRMNRGSAPEETHKGGGKIIRTILQQLGEAGLVEKNKGKGRNVSPEGVSFLTRISKKIESEEGS